MPDFLEIEDVVPRYEALTGHVARDVAWFLAYGATCSSRSSARERSELADMANPIGQLLAADETFTHQMVETFATVGSTDLAWTEKVCAMAAARDGSLQLGFGLGKYTNRNVMDAYAGISRGVEQITVRASRRLSPEPERTVIGPIQYEIVEPLQSVRFALEPNDCQPIAFDWRFDRVCPPQVEDRTHLRAGYRVSAELVRYHQIGVCRGWVEVDGERHEMDPESWVSTRDHSWGVRYGVGLPAADLEPTPQLGQYEFFWAPILFERSDASRYGVWLEHSQIESPGLVQRHGIGTVESPDGQVERIVDLEPDLRYDSDNRRLLGGEVVCTMHDGTKRPLRVEPVSSTGFHLGTGLYFGFDGHHHGEWRGELHVDGERIPDCSEPATARRVHQIRDTVVRVVDEVGGGVGIGNWQPIIVGHHAPSGLSADDSFF